MFKSTVTMKLQQQQVMKEEKEKIEENRPRAMSMKKLCKWSREEAEDDGVVRELWHVKHDRHDRKRGHTSTQTNASPKLYLIFPSPTKVLISRRLVMVLHSGVSTEEGLGVA